MKLNQQTQLAILKLKHSIKAFHVEILQSFSLYVLALVLQAGSVD
jgi:hypothetical protein